MGDSTSSRLPQPGGDAAPGAITRRALLSRAVAGVAAVAGLSLFLPGRSGERSEQATPAPLDLDEDSIFTPRADQRERVLGRK